MTNNSKILLQAATFLFLLSPSVAFGQTNTSLLKKIYVQLGFGGTNQQGTMVQFGIQAVFKKNWTTTFSYYDITMNPKNLPNDYTPGYTLFILPDPYPEQEITLYNLTGGKYFELGRRFWVITEAGVSLVKGDKFTFSPRAVATDGWGYTNSNYATEREHKTALGGMLKADFTWAFSSFAGLSAGAFANINSIQSPVGGELKLIVGWMNRKPKN